MHLQDQHDLRVIQKVPEGKPPPPLIYTQFEVFINTGDRIKWLHKYRLDIKWIKICLQP